MFPPPAKRCKGCGACWDMCKNTCHNSGHFQNALSAGSDTVRTLMTLVVLRGAPAETSLHRSIKIVSCRSSLFHLSSVYNCSRSGCFCKVCTCKNSCKTPSRRHRCSLPPNRVRHACPQDPERALLQVIKLSAGHQQVYNVPEMLACPSLVSARQTWDFGYSKIISAN